MARIGPLLLPLLLLSSHSVCGRSEELSLTPVELAPVPCNDKAVGKLSRLAMTYINEDRPDGYKFALNRVANVHLHAQVSAAAPTAQERSPLQGGCSLIFNVGKYPLPDSAFEPRELMFVGPSGASFPLTHSYPLRNADHLEVTLKKRPGVISNAEGNSS